MLHKILFHNHKVQVDPQKFIMFHHFVHGIKHKIYTMWRSVNQRVLI